MKVAVTMLASAFLIASCSSRDDQTYESNYPETSTERSPTVATPADTNRSSTVEKPSASTSEMEKGNLPRQELAGQSDRSLATSGTQGQQREQDETFVTPGRFSSQSEQHQPGALTPRQDSKSESESQSIREMAKRTTRASQIQKASEIIGKEVQNQQGEKLGTIEDLAVDMQTGRISYAALASGGFLGVGDKLIAVPLAAFSKSGEEDGTLQLAANKSQIENSAGFDKNNWPAVAPTAWGADASSEQPSRTESTRGNLNDVNQKESSSRTQEQPGAKEDAGTKPRSTQQRDESSSTYNRTTRDSSPELAQNARSQQRPALPGSSTRKTDDIGAAGQHAERHSGLPGADRERMDKIGKVHKATDLIGMEVKNAANEKLGDVKDFVLDLKSGRVAYAVVSVGGMPGMTGKLVAVPASAFEQKQNEKTLVLKADKQKLQNAPAFDPNNPPARASWGAEPMDEHKQDSQREPRGALNLREREAEGAGARFSTERSGITSSESFEGRADASRREGERYSAQAKSEVEAASSRLGQNNRSIAGREAGQARENRPDRHDQLGGKSLTSADLSRASELIGSTVKNPQDEKLGDVKDFIIDLHSGRVTYAILSVGGFLGVGDKMIAVPTAALSQHAGEKELLLHADKEKLEGAPSFSSDNWPDFSNPSWGAKVYQYHGKQPFWEGNENEHQNENARPDRQNEQKDDRALPQGRKL